MPLDEDHLPAQSQGGQGAGDPAQAAARHQDVRGHFVRRRAGRRIGSLGSADDGGGQRTCDKLTTGQTHGKRGGERDPGPARPLIQEPSKGALFVPLYSDFSS